MRTFRKLLTILLAVLLFSSFSVAFAATDAYYIQSKNYISVSGTASAGWLPTPPLRLWPHGHDRQ